MVKNNNHGNNKAINIRILFYSKSRFKNSWRGTTFMAPHATGRNCNQDRTEIELAENDLNPAITLFLHTVLGRNQGLFLAIGRGLHIRRGGTP